MIKLLKRLFLGLIFFLPLFLSVDNTNAKEAPDRGPLSKVTFIHYRRANAKPADRGSGGKNECYGFIAKGLKWKVNEPVLINPINSYGLSENFVKSSVDLGLSQWENFGDNIFGDSSIESTANASFDFVDDKNVIAFGDYSDSNAIAVTNVWGYFYGPIATREIVEWDMILNARYIWGNALINPSVMDLQNIVTHELGHSAGLSDLYNTSCSQETMYGYSTEGEVTKRSLESGDIKGITTLYY